MQSLRVSDRLERIEKGEGKTGSLRLAFAASLRVSDWQEIAGGEMEKRPLSPLCRYKTVREDERACGMKRAQRRE